MRLSQLVLGMLVGTAFGLSCLKYRQRRIKLTEFLCWSAIWLLAAIAVILPDTTTFIARILDIGRGVDVIIYLSIVLSFYLIFCVYEKIDRLEREITKIVRHLALSERHQL
jgi:hypothetical protein